MEAEVGWGGTGSREMSREAVVWADFSAAPSEGPFSAAFPLPTLYANEDPQVMGC